MTTIPTAERPAINAVEVHWAADEVAELIRRVPAESVVGKVLARAHLELSSLKQSAGGTVVGPFRLRAAA
jgi:hypothetical protein